MELAVAATGHTLFASFVPPAESIRDVIRAISGFVAAARADEVGEAVVVRSSRTAGFRLFEVTETTPCYRNIVRCAFDIEVAVTAVLKIAVIDPYIRGFVETEVVPSVTVVCTGTLKGQIAQKEVVAFQIQNTRIVLVLLGRDQFLARQCHDGQVRLVRTDVVCNGDVFGDENHSVAFAQSGDQFAFAGYFDRFSIAASGHVCARVAP